MSEENKNKEYGADNIQVLASKYPIVTILGPRQSGKTTLVKAIFKLFSIIQPTYWLILCHEIFNIII